MVFRKVEDRPVSKEVKLKPPIVVWKSTNYRLIAKADVTTYPVMSRVDRRIKTVYILEELHLNSLSEKVWVVVEDLAPNSRLAFVLHELAETTGNVPSSWIEENKPKTTSTVLTGGPYR